MDVEEFIRTYPRAYHMAESGSWGSIKSNGLLSTSALLDHYGISGKCREAIEQKHRPEKITVKADGKLEVVVRDQKPMDDHGLARALEGTGMTPKEWYQTLNSKVFFWVSKHRLHKLLNASAYRNLEHDVLTIDTESLVRAHIDRIVLSPINSGVTKPFPTPRGPTTFKSISEYPWHYWAEEKKRPKWDCVVELCVERGVPDIADHVLSVYRMLGSSPIREIQEPG